MTRSLVCAVLLVSVLSVSVIPARAADIVINEIHFEPEDKTVSAEFIEILNVSAAEVDLSGWFFSDGIFYEFPAGKTIEAGGYLVIAEDPEVLATALSYEGALGPFEGRLDNGGERVTLRNAVGQVEDEVSFRSRFPWPIASAGKGSSMELMDPMLDNNLGGSWRASGTSIVPPPEERTYLITRSAEDWLYRRGETEASDPVDTWRAPKFATDETWIQAQTPVGFNDDDDNTVVKGMEDVFSSLFFRKEFVYDGEEIPAALMMSYFLDDGAIIWVNGVEIARINMDEGPHGIDSRARRSSEARWTDTFLEVNPANFLRKGRNIIAAHAFNQRATSNDFTFDVELFTPARADLGAFRSAPPSPGLVNSVYVRNAPPQIRQIGHAPQQPAAGVSTVITAKVDDLDGVASVTALYQVVSAGDFIPAYLPHIHSRLLSRANDPLDPNPEFEDPKNWTSIEMKDDGTGGDEVAGDSIFSATLPGQPHRTLVRYRIFAEDPSGLSVRVPYDDDRQLNFALWVSDGVPEYTASLRSVHPEGAGHSYPTEVMNALPVYTLVTRLNDYNQCVAYSGAFQIPKSNENARDKFNWEGAFVYEGIVYDHMRYRLRQANDRYGGSGKRSMRFRFNKGSYLRTRDNFGQRLPT
ncbi:MAG: lamin tail domain-containing protein, partial [Planctomycetota bacterium]